MHWKSRKCFLLTTFIWIMTDPANGGTGTGDTIGSKPHGHFSWRKTGHTHHSGQQL